MTNEELLAAQAIEWVGAAQVYATLSAGYRQAAEACAIAGLRDRYIEVAADAVQNEKHALDCLAMAGRRAPQN